MSLKLLIVDDEPAILTVYAAVFAMHGFEIDTLDRGDVVYERCKASRPDVVLLDLMLPGRDGCAVLEQLRSDPELADLPVLLITGFADGVNDYEARAYAAGADAFLTKPASHAEVADTLRRIATRDKVAP